MSPELREIIPRRQDSGTPRARRSPRPKRRWRAGGRACRGSPRQRKSSSIKLQAKVGFMAELYRVASGKVFLSSFDDERLESYFNKHPLIPVTDYTITDISRLKEDISLVKSRGYSVEYMENEDRIISLASPIKDHTGNIIAALAIMVLSQSISSRDIPLIGEGLKETAQRISEALGDKSKVL